MIIDCRHFLLKRHSPSKTSRVQILNDFPVHHPLHEGINVMTPVFTVTQQGISRSIQAVSSQRSTVLSKTVSSHVREIGYFQNIHMISVPLVAYLITNTFTVQQLEMPSLPSSRNCYYWNQIQLPSTLIGYKNSAQ